MCIRDSIFSKLKSAPSLTEEQVDSGLKEIRLALLEADVALPVVKDFIKNVKPKAIGQEIIRSTSPGQMIVKIVYDELVNILGSKNVIEVADAYGVKNFINASSSEVYGEPAEIPQHENTTPLNSRVPYAIVKNICESFLKSYQKNYIKRKNSLEYQPIFVIGANRSGTAVCTKLLEGHPCILETNIDKDIQIDFDSKKLEGGHSTAFSESMHLLEGLNIDGFKKSKDKALWAHPLNISYFYKAVSYTHLTLPTSDLV